MPGVSVRLEGRKPPGDDVAPIGVLKQILSLFQSPAELGVKDAKKVKYSNARGRG